MTWLNKTGRETRGNTGRIFTLTLPPSIMCSSSAAVYFAVFKLKLFVSLTALHHLLLVGCVCVQCICTTAQYAFCKVYFSAQPNKLRHILNFDKYYPIEHIFVPACSSAFLSFSDFQTLNPWFPPKYATVSTPSSVNMPLSPPLLLIVSDTAS